MSKAARSGFATIVAFCVASCGEPAVQVPAGRAYDSKLMVASTSAQAAQLVADPQGCNIEFLDGVAFGGTPKATLRKTGTVSGWLYSSHSNGSDLRASVRVINMATAAAWDREIANWRPRPDVLAARGQDYGALPGFEQPVDFSTLEPGTYRIALVFADSGTTYICDNGREVRLQ